MEVVEVAMSLTGMQIPISHGVLPISGSWWRQSEAPLIHFVLSDKVQVRAEADNVTVYCVDLAAETACSWMAAFHVRVVVTGWRWIPAATSGQGIGASGCTITSEVGVLAQYEFFLGDSLAVDSPAVEVVKEVLYVLTGQQRSWCQLYSVPEASLHPLAGSYEASIVRVIFRVVAHWIILPSERGHSGSCDVPWMFEAVN